MRGVIVIAAFLMAGCAMVTPPETDWTKAGARAGDLAVDLYVCRQWSGHPDNPKEVHEPYLQQCMTSHGWRQVAAEP